jgi:protein-S-isoprenylcysteine O-methyltransferase Ste14
VHARIVDRGRLVVLPVVVLLATSGLAVLLHGGAGRPGAAGLLDRLTTLLVCCFYLVVCWCYLRRDAAVATSSSPLAHAAAVTATLTPFVFAFLPDVPAGIGRELAAGTLLVAGTGWSVWSVRSLGRNVGILAQARAVVHSGPYRWVRHPLYLGELVAAAGLALRVGTGTAAACWVGLMLLQVYRASREEAVLAGALPDYAGYRSRTAAVLPGIF